MVYLIALLLWIAPALVLGAALLWVCFRPGKRPAVQAEQTAVAEQDVAAATNAVPG